MSNVSNTSVDLLARGCDRTAGNDEVQLYKQKIFRFCLIILKQLNALILESYRSAYRPEIGSAEAGMYVRQSSPEIRHFDNGESSVFTYFGLPIVDINFSTTYVIFYNDRYPGRIYQIQYDVR